MPPKPTRRLHLLLGFSVAVAARADPAGGDQPTPSQTRDELFLRVFQHAPPLLPVSSYVLVAIDGTTRQKVPAVLSPRGQDILLEGRSLVALLTPLVRPDLVRQLEQRIDGQGWLPRAALEEAGMTTAFNLRKFEFAIETPPGLREKRVRYLNRPLPDPSRAEAIRPAPVSGFLNFNLKGIARSVSSAAGLDRSTEAAIAIDGALNVQGVVLEGSAYGQTGHPGAWQRGDLRLVYDQPQRALRFTAGDLNYPVVGYQTMVNLLGIGVARDFSLQPHRPTWRTNQFEFYLDRPAEVKVWVNDSLVNTLQLPAGAHDLRGLNAAVGQNDVRLVVEDGAGRREALHFSFIFNPILLEKGRHLFTYNAGFRREQAGGDYRYDLKRPVFSGSYLAGLTNETTLGAYTQADEARSLFGLKALHTFALGTLQVDAAASQSDLGLWDAGARLELTGLSSTAKGHSGIQSQLAVEYLGRHFGSIDATAPAPGATLSFLASLAVPLGARTTGQLSGNYTPARRAGDVDLYGASATLTRRWGRAVSGSVSLRHRRADHLPAETELGFGLSVSFSKGTASFYAAKELESDTVTARWDSGRPSNGTAPYGFAEARVGSDSREYRAGAGYWGNHGLAELAHTRTEAAPSYARDETTVRLQGALVFADTTFGLARRVGENFAIVTGEHGLAQVALKVDPDGSGGSRARTGWLSPAVLGDLASYRLREVRVEPVDAPLGATPDKTTFTLAPAYKSGFLLKLGKEPQIVALGRLVDDQRGALAHLAIEIRRLDRPGDKPFSTFTSRSGAFQLPDLKPGRYEIRPAASPRWGGVIVEIRAAPDGLHRLGEIMLPPGP